MLSNAKSRDGDLTDKKQMHPKNPIKKILETWTN
jgi:hypothetical protein